MRGEGWLSTNSCLPTESPDVSCVGVVRGQRLYIANTAAYFNAKTIYAAMKLMLILACAFLSVSYGACNCARQAKLKKAFEKYNDTCSCETSYDGLNCAHFLSNALISAGFTGLGGLEDVATCPTSRPIRSKELHEWFKSNFKACSEDNLPKSGFVLIYQERRSDGQGHVLLMKLPGRETRGNFYDWDIVFYYK